MHTGGLAVAILVLTCAHVVDVLLHDSTAARTGVGKNERLRHARSAPNHRAMDGTIDHWSPHRYSNCVAISLVAWRGRYLRSLLLASELCLVDDGWRWWRVGQIDRACVEFSAATRCFLPSSAAVKNMRAATLKRNYTYIFPRRKKDGRKK